MKAVIFKKYGKPEVLQYTDIDKPIPDNGEILVRIHASSVTAEEPKMRSFNHPPLLKLPVGFIFGFKRPQTPVLGMEFSGTIESTGTEVKNYKINDQIFGYTGLRFGAHAEYICIPEKELIHFKPQNLSFAESATLVNGPLSALTYLKKKANIQRGDHILIYGASGSVGTAAIQLAKYFGATVTAVCSTKNIQVVKSVGADHVIDYTREDFTKRDVAYDILFDTVGKTSMKQCMKLLNPDGRYLLTEFGLSHIIAMIYTSLFKRKKVIVAASNFYWEKEDLIFIKEITEKGYFKPVIDKSFPLEKMVEAHAYVEAGHKVGNVAIIVREDNLKASTINQGQI